MHVIAGLRDYSVTLGWRGPVAMLSAKLMGYPKALRVTPPGYAHPVTLRLGTTDNSLYRSVLLGEEYACAHVDQPRVIVDAGANVGMASIYFAHRYPAAHIVALEPDAANFAQLQQNAAPYPAITPIRAALWTQDGTIRLHDPGVGEWGYRVDPDQGIEVPCLSVQTLLTRYALPTIDLFKVDIEGAERDVFADAPWLASVRCLAIEVTDAACQRTLDRTMAGWTSTLHGETVVYRHDP